MNLNDAAKTVLAEAGMTPAAWARLNGYSGGTWGGDACGCPDDRCMNGFHHEPQQECGCLESLLTRYLNGEDSAFFAEDASPPPVQRQDGRWYRPRKLVACAVTEDEELAGVVVLGTHSPRAAQALADSYAAWQLGSSYRAADPANVWWRNGYDGTGRGWVTDETHGRAGVWFRQIVEVTDGK